MKPVTSQLIYTMLAWYQHVSSLASPILERHLHRVTYINSCWLNDFVRLLQKYKVEIKLKLTYVQPLQRENDSFIMESILNDYSSTLTIQNFIHTAYIYKSPYSPISPT